MWLAVSTIAKAASRLRLASSFWPTIHASFLFTVVHNVFVYNYLQHQPSVSPTRRGAGVCAGEETRRHEKWCGRVQSPF